MISGIIYIIRHGLQWKDAPPGYGPSKTLYNRFVRWSRLGVFARIFASPAAKGGALARLMIDATHLKAPPHGGQPAAKVGPRTIRRTKGGLNSKLHAACDGWGRSVALLLTEDNAAITTALLCCCRSCHGRANSWATAASPALGSEPR